MFSMASIDMSTLLSAITMAFYTFFITSYTKNNDSMMGKINELEKQLVSLRENDARIDGTHRVFEQKFLYLADAIEKNTSKTAECIEIITKIATDVRVVMAKHEDQE